MIDLIQLAAQIGGVGGLLAILIFLMYRRDRNATEKMWRESKKFTEDRLTELHQEALEAQREHTEAVIGYTKATTELTTLLVRMNGKQK